MLINCLAVGAGGACGAVARYLLTLIPIKLDSGFPLITLCVNILGAFCIGLIVTLAGKDTGLNPNLLLFLKVGLCGGFTTFSTFSLETLGLLQNGKFLMAAAYIFFSVLLCLAGVFGAERLIR